jgi:photosystem II stability/assembly factor-like uncharacterized protein
VHLQLRASKASVEKGLYSAAATIILVAVCLVLAPLGTSAQNSPRWVHRSPQPRTTWLSQVDCPGTNVCYAVGKTNSSTAIGPTTFMATLDGGISWTTQTFNWELGTVQDPLSCPSVSVCFLLVTPSPNTTPSSPAVARTEDGGKTWATFRPGQFDTLTAISCPTVLVCHVLGATAPINGRPGPSVLLTTTDDARTWSSRSVDGPGVLALTCPAPGICYGTREGSVGITRDAGQT